MESSHLADSATLYDMWNERPATCELRPAVVYDRGSPNEDTVCLTYRQLDALVQQIGDFLVASLRSNEVSASVTFLFCRL